MRIDRLGHTADALLRVAEAVVIEVGKKAVEQAHTGIQGRQTLARKLEALDERVRKLEAP